MSLFRNSDGSFKWSIIPAIVGLMATAFVVALRHEIWFNFTHEFWSEGIWQIVGPIVGSGFGYIYYKKYASSSNVAASVGLQIAAVFIFFGGLLIPPTETRGKVADGITSVNVYYSSGKIINVTDSSKDTYYFDHYTVSPTDSAYIVKYHEEPGFNNTVKNREGIDSSKAPRANESWSAPIPNETKKYIGHY